MTYVRKRGVGRDTSGHDHRLRFLGLPEQSFRFASIWHHVAFQNLLLLCRLQRLLWKTEETPQFLVKSLSFYTVSYSADTRTSLQHVVCYLTFLNSNLQNKVPCTISCFIAASCMEAWWIKVHSLHFFVVVVLRARLISKPSTFIITSTGVLTS